MSGRVGDGVETWADQLESCISDSARFDRVVVLRETGSTQDAARAHANGKPGLIVTTGRQIAGRGRLGRVWHDAPGASLAISFVLDATKVREDFSLVVGLAACMACERFVGRLGLRWPNDVVETASAGSAGGRKLAGVLIERHDDLLIVGVGINVRHRESDWPEELRATSCSLAQLGAEVKLIDVAVSLTESLTAWLDRDMDSVLAGWSERDTLLGTSRTFVNNGETIRGVVTSINPLGEIVVRTEAGDARSLPALTTSISHEREPGSALG